MARYLSTKKMYIHVCISEDFNFKIEKIVPGLYHEYVDENPYCSRNQDSGNKLNSSHWTVSIPHPQDSGKCFTYKYECKNMNKDNLTIIAYILLNNY